MKKQVENWIAPMVKNCKYAFTAVLILVTTLSGWSDNRDDLVTMSCIGSIQLSLSSTGVSVITPEFLLTSTHASYNNFIVDIMGPLKDSVWCEHIGMTFMVSVIDTVENNSCMSEVLVLDKLAPTIECSDTVVPCNMDPWEGDPNLFLDTLYDNCTDFADLDIYFTQEIFNYPCDSQYNGMLLRTWFVEDIYGNATSCTHRIFFDKPLLDSIEIPANDTLDCPAVNTDPEFTGVPTYKGEEIDGFCQIVSWHTDNVIQMCGNSYKIMRQWNIMDWCSNQTRVETQEIVILDTIPPVLECPPNATVNTDPDECTYTLDIESITGTDNCSDIADWTIIVRVDGQFVMGSTVQLDTGTHLVEYLVWDPCDNPASCSYEITVEDNEAPWATCDGFIVAIDANNTVTFSVSQLEDFFFYDNCEVVDTLISRMTTNCGTPEDTIPGDEVTFCCEDVNEDVMLVVQYSDAAGNTNWCMVTVDVQDKLPPEILCEPNDTIFGECNALINVPQPTVSDNCDIYTLTNSYNGTDNASGFYPVGTTVVVWTATDPGGNSAQCTMWVIVEDNVPPVITCPTDIVVDSDPGVCEANVTVAVPGVFEECGIDTLYNDYNNTSNASDTYPVGVHTVIWYVFDEGGNSDTCEMIITVEDNENPQITCPVDIIVDSDPGVCEADVTVPLPTGVDDNCGVATTINDYNNTNNASDIYPVGTTTVIWTVTDIYGNSDTCSMTVTVEDNENPQITCPVDIVVDSDPGVCEADVTVPLPTGVDDNCGVASTINDFNNTGNASSIYPVGTTTVIWTVTDIHGNSDTCSMTVTVEDNEDPVITCPADIVVDADPGTCEADVTVPLPTGVDDNCGVASTINDFNGTSNASGIYTAGTTTVIWTVTDIHGNSDTCSMTVTVVDNEDPQIICSDDVTVTNDPTLCEADVTVPPPTSATDNCGEVMSVTNSYTGTDNASGIYPVGTTVVIWTATDSSGNSDTCSITVTVEDNENPEITCPTDIVVDSDPGVCEADVIVPLPTGVDDNCGVATTINDFNSTADASGIYPVGTTTVIWTVTDIYGNSDTCSMTITVEDNEDPMITCPSDGLQAVDPGECEADVTIPLPFGISDNCGVDTVYNDFTLTGNASGTYPVGTTLVIWTVVDIYGNSDTCSMLVTVFDNEDPTITCPADIVVDSDPGVCEADVTVPIPTGVNDNCGVDTVYNDYTLSGDASGIYPVGTTIVVWTVVDIYGHSDTCSMTVTVVDNENPTIICPEDVTANTEQGECDAFVMIPPPTGVSDNCEVHDVINSFTQTGNASGTYPAGETTVVWLVEDIHGNIDTCTMTVTVFDSSLPIITCPDNITVNNDPGVCSADVIVPIPMVETECGTGGTAINDYNNTGNASDTYPVGTTTIEWVAFNGPGNTDTCYMTVTVIDNENPTITCPPSMSVNNDPGVCGADVTVPLPTGVDDNCEVDTVFNDFTSTGNASGFYPVGTTVVNWTVTDIYGHTAQCSMLVTVVDNEDPIIFCPPDTTLDCTIDINNLPNLGDPTATDNCGPVTITSITVDDLNACNTGTITITYTATDGFNNESSCDQIITVEITNPLDTMDIIWPETPLIVTDCTTLDPDSLGSEPEIDTTNASCYNISVDYTDNPIDPLNYCYAIERIWTIIDSCQMMPGSSDGVFTFTQEIFVDDVTPPILIIPADTLVPCDTFIQLEPATATDCGPVIITNDSPFAVSNGPDASGNYPNGVTLVTFTATDTCNNTITDILTITVQDTTGCICGDTIPPELVCDKVVILVPDTLETVIPVAFLVETVSDNCTDSADLFLSFALDSLVPTITLDCDDIFPEVDTMVSIYAIDESGNIDSCVATVHYLDVDSFCLSPSPMTLAGEIETEIGEGVQDVEVNLVESNFETVATDSEGQYQFDELNAGYTYTIQPYYNEGALNGVNTYDLVLIQKHILGLQHLDSPFKLIAADANKSGSISSLDIIELRKLILGINDEFSNNTSWRFIDRKYDFPNTSNPFFYPFPEQVQAGPLAHSMMFNDFVGVKVGDVDGSAIPNQFAIAEDRSGNPEAIISYEDQNLKAGQSVTVKITWNTATEIWTGMQFALQVDERVASIIGVSDLSNQLFQNDHIGQQWANEGVITTSWSDPIGRDIENQNLISVEIIAHQDCKLSDIIKLDERILSPEAYGDNYGYYKVKLSPQNSVMEDIAFLSLGQNVPNPFNESTVFPVESRVGQPAKLRIYNSTGREIHNSDLELLQGVNWIEIDKEVPGNPGVYYYEVSTSQSTAIRKMVYIR